MINREVSCALLEERGAYVVAVEDGRQAVEAFADAAEGFFDAVLMDVHMPVMGGVEAIGLIRAMDRGDSRCVPVFVLTADCSPREEAALTDAGASGFLLKPLDVARLAALIA